MTKAIALATVGTMLLSTSQALAAPIAGNTVAPASVVSPVTFYSPINVQSYSMSAKHFSGCFALDFSNYDLSNVSNMRFPNGKVNVQQYDASAGKYIDIGTYELQYISGDGYFDFEIDVNLDRGDRVWLNMEVKGYLYNMDAVPFQSVYFSDMLEFTWN